MAELDSETFRLVIRAQLGDRRASEGLLRLASPRLHTHLTHLLGDASIADDVTQDTLVLVWKRIGQLRDPRAFWAWAFRIASRRACRARGSARGLSGLSGHTEPTWSPADPDPLEARALADLARSNVRALSPAQRELIALHYAEGFSLAACAAILEIPAGTAKSRLSAALSQLRAGCEASLGSDRVPASPPTSLDPPPLRRSP